MIEIERRVAAAPAEVYRYLTDSALWSRWQGLEAVIDPRPGGSFTMHSPADLVASGVVVEVVPDTSISFTWGWDGHPGVPPGSTLVTIELVPDGAGTLIRLSHRDLPESDVEVHVAGWTHYMDRLALVVDGGDPGPDRGVAA